MKLMCKILLSDLYDREITETKGNIENYNVWIRGTKDEDERVSFMRTVLDLEAYIEVLQELRNEL